MSFRNILIFSVFILALLSVSISKLYLNALVSPVAFNKLVLIF